MNVLITGSEGHVGRHLVAEVERLGHTVWCVDIKPDHHKRYFCVDVRDGADLERAFQESEPAVVFHLAGMVSRVTCEGAHQQALSANVMGTRNVAESCERAGARLIHFSTSEVYGPTEGEMLDFMEPNNWYGHTKMMSESVVDYYAANYELDALIVRPFMLYHEDEAATNNRSAMIRFVRSICNRERFTVHGGAMRSWMHMSDAVRFIASLMDADGSGPRTMNVGSSAVRPILDLVRLIEAETGIDAAYDVHNLPSRMTLAKRPNLDAAIALGLKETVSLEDGIRRVCKAYMERRC